MKCLIIASAGNSIVHKDKTTTLAPEDKEYIIKLTLKLNQDFNFEDYEPEAISCLRPPGKLVEACAKAIEETTPKLQRWEVNDDLGVSGKNQDTAAKKIVDHIARVEKQYELMFLLTLAHAPMAWKIPFLLGSQINLKAKPRMGSLCQPGEAIVLTWGHAPSLSRVSVVPDNFLHRT